MGSFASVFQNESQPTMKVLLFVALAIAAVMAEPEAEPKPEADAAADAWYGYYGRRWGGYYGYYRGKRSPDTESEPTAAAEADPEADAAADAWGGYYGYPYARAYGYHYLGRDLLNLRPHLRPTLRLRPNPGTMAVGVDTMAILIGVITVMDTAVVTGGKPSQ